MKVKLTQEAINKLEQNLIFLKNKLGIPQTKLQKIRSQLLQRAKEIGTHPYKGQVEPYLNSLNYEYRRVIEKNFKIIYFIENNTVYITDFFHTHRHPFEMTN